MRTSFTKEDRLTQMKEEFDKWFESHGRLQYSPVFNTNLEYLITDGSRKVKERTLYWLYRHTWGRSSDVAIDSIGRRLGMKDCAAALRVDISTVSRAFAVHERHGLVDIKGHSIIAIVKSPTASQQMTDRDLMRNKVARGDKFHSPFHRHRESWFAVHPQEASEYAFNQLLIKEARANTKRIDAMILHDYRRPMNSKVPADDALPTDHALPANAFKGCEPEQQKVADMGTTELPDTTSNRSGILIEHPLTDSNGDLSVGQSGSGAIIDRPTEPPSAVESKNDDIRAAIPDEVLSACNDVPSFDLYDLIRTHLRGAPLTRFTDRIRQRQHKITDLGLLARLADDVGQAYVEGVRRTQTQATANAAAEAQTRQEVTEREQRLLEEDALRSAAELVFDAMDETEKAARRSAKMSDPVHAKRLASLPMNVRLQEIDSLIIGDLKSASRKSP